MPVRSSKMNARCAADKAEQIKWWDALDILCGLGRAKDIAKGLQLARVSHHPDAHWLCSLFPDVGATVTKAQVLNVMKEQGEDPRAIFIHSRIRHDRALLRRAAELGYANAQAEWVWFCEDEDRCAWIENAAAQGNRAALFWLGQGLWGAQGCENDHNRAIELWKEAAELGHSKAQFLYGLKGFLASDWQRYRWWGRSAARRQMLATMELPTAAKEHLKQFDEGEGSRRVLFELGSAFKGHVDAANDTVFDRRVDVEELRVMLRCVELHDEWTTAAKAAIECWVAAGIRHRVMKDIRVVIARLAWEEPWAWSGVGRS